MLTSQIVGRLAKKLRRSKQVDRTAAYRTILGMAVRKSDVVSVAMPSVLIPDLLERTVHRLVRPGLRAVRSVRVCHAAQAIGVLGIAGVVGVVAVPLFPSRKAGQTVGDNQRLGWAGHRRDLRMIISEGLSIRSQR